MYKEEIIAKIDSLTRRVKTPGRAYSKTQREDMRNEISNLSIELNRIKFQEDLILIGDFEKTNPDFYFDKKENLKIKINSLVEDLDDNLKRIIEFRIRSFFADIGHIEHSQNETKSLKEALSFLDKTEKIPSSNSNWLKDKKEIQKILAANYKSLTSKIGKLRDAMDEILLIKRFFDEDTSLSGFVFMTNPIFSEASDFDKGFATVEQNSTKMYFSFTGSAYKIDTSENEIPKIEKQRTNPDLIPFKINDDTFSRLYGYKNSKNEIIIPAMFKHASPFINGFAKVGNLKKERGKYQNTKVTYGLIDSTGRIVLPFDFIELGDVCNDIVLYKKNIYREGYVRANSFSFDLRHELKHLGLFSGYLAYNEIKPAIQKEIESLREIESSIPSLKTNGEVDNAHEKIKGHRVKIDFYLKYITVKE